MKLAIRAFALSVVLAGAFAVSLSSGSAAAVPNHMAATSGLPVPVCTPDMPCQPDPGTNGGIR